jgi:hypothetical protein
VTAEAGELEGLDAGHAWVDDLQEGGPDLYLDAGDGLSHCRESPDLAAREPVASLIRARRAEPIGLRSSAFAITRSMWAANALHLACNAPVVVTPMSASPP